MMQFADLHRTERQFEEKDLVLLKFHPYRQQSLAKEGSSKLSPRFYGCIKPHRMSAL